MNNFHVYSLPHASSNSLISLEPAVTTECAEKKRPVPGREQAEGGNGRGAGASTRPRNGRREFLTATVQRTVIHLLLNFKVSPTRCHFQPYSRIITKEQKLN
jgi:hypothetical protein